jgi:hypothetical protein
MPPGVPGGDRLGGKATEMGATMKRRLIPTLLASVLLVTGGAAVAAGPEADPSSREALPKQVVKQLAEVKRATERFRDVKVAVAAGYQPAEECVESRAGAMGLHYLNGELLGDPALDPRKPEVLIYLPGKGDRLRLVAVEWLALDTGQPAPRVLGRRLQGPMTHGGTAPSHYDLHAWLFEPNPRGTFAQWNPRLRCA